MAGRWREAARVYRDPRMALILVLGLYPKLVFGVTDEAVGGLMRLLGG